MNSRNRCEKFPYPFKAALRAARGPHSPAVRALPLRSRRGPAVATATPADTTKPRKPMIELPGRFLAQPGPGVSNDGPCLTHRPRPGRAKLARRDAAPTLPGLAICRHRAKIIRPNRGTTAAAKHQQPMRVDKHCLGYSGWWTRSLAEVSRFRRSVRDVLQRLGCFSSLTCVSAHAEVAGTRRRQTAKRRSCSAPSRHGRRFWLPERPVDSDLMSASRPGSVQLRA